MTAVTAGSPFQAGGSCDRLLGLYEAALNNMTLEPVCKLTAALPCLVEIHLHAVSRFSTSIEYL